MIFKGYESNLSFNNINTKSIIMIFYFLHLMYFVVEFQDENITNGISSFKLIKNTLKSNFIE